MLLKELKEEFLFDCVVRELSKRTIHNYELILSYFAEYLSRKGVRELGEVTPAHIKSFIGVYITRGNKPAYINDLLKVVRCMFSYAYQEGYTDTLVTQRIRNVKESKVLIHAFNDNEIAGMVQYFHGSDYLSLRNRLIMMLLFDTGIRISELIHMELKQIQPEHIIIHGKGRKDRLVPKSALVSKWLRRYLAARDDYFADKLIGENVFLSKNGKPLTDEAITKFMKTAAKAIGVRPTVRVSPHTCRHTFAHQQLKNGLDLYSLSRLLGHENVSITQRYLEAIQDDRILEAARETGVLANL